jgi:hypothetical protein
MHPDSSACEMLNFSLGAIGPPRSVFHLAPSHCSHIKTRFCVFVSGSTRSHKFSISAGADSQSKIIVMIMIAPRARSRTIDFNLMACVSGAHSAAHRLNLFGATLSAVPLCPLSSIFTVFCVYVRESVDRAPPPSSTCPKSKIFRNVTHGRVVRISTWKQGRENGQRNKASA